MAKREGVWFVAEFDGHKAVLCKHKAKKWSEEAKTAITSSKFRIEVEICYDFFGPLRPVQAMGPDGKPAMGITREPVVTGSHFTLEKCPVYVNLAMAIKLFFLDEMTPFDREMYENYIEHAEKNCEAQRLAVSPIQMPDAPSPLTMKVGPDGIPHGTLDLRGMRGG